MSNLFHIESVHTVCIQFGKGNLKITALYISYFVLGMHGSHKKSVMTDKRSDTQMELCGLIFPNWFVIKLYKCFFVRVK